MLNDKNNDPKWLGRRFNQLVVIGFVHKKGAWHWVCRCDCGVEITTLAGNVKQGRSKSCGCVGRKKATQQLTKHGMSGTRLYNTWQNMKARCHNPKNSWYDDYGGRGIVVCPEWRDCPDVFMEWALATGYKDDLSIERIDVNGSYSPDNCEWIPMKKQAWNRRNSFMVRYKGEEKCVAEWCQLLELDEKVVRSRLQRGKSVEDAFTTPVERPEDSIAEQCRERGLNYHTIMSRINIYGMSVDEALDTPVVPKENSLRAKCTRAGMNYNTVKQRINAYGWTEEDALSTPIGQKRTQQ